MKDSLPVMETDLSERELAEIPRLTDVERILSATPAQCEVLSSRQWFRGGSPMLVTELEISDAIDLEALRLMFERLLERHAALRTRIVRLTGRDPVLVVDRQADLPWHVRDMRRSVDPGVSVSWLVVRLRCSEADTDKSPLMRIELVRISKERWVLLWSVHTAIVDGRSFSLLCAELARLYMRRAEQKTAQTSRQDDSIAYRQWLASRDRHAAREHWIRELSGLGTPATVSLGRGIEAETGEHAVVTVAVPAARFDRLYTHAHAHLVRMETLIQGAWALLLSRYSGHDEVLYSLVSSGRPAQLSCSESMIGHFETELLQRACIDEQAEPWQWLAALQASVDANRKHGYIGSAAIRQAGSLPDAVRLTESQVDFRDYPTGAELLSSLDLVDESSGRPTDRLLLAHSYYQEAGHPLTLVAHAGEELLLELHYDKGRFDQADMRNMLDNLAWVMGQLTTAPSLRELSTQPPLARAATLAIGEGVRIDHTGGTGLLELFRQQVARCPDRLALIDGDRVLDYRRLDALSSCMAGLLAARGAGCGDVIAIRSEFDLSTAVLLLGILKSGAAWLLIDTQSSAAQVRDILAAVRPRLLVVDTEDSLPGVSIVPHASIGRLCTAATEQADRLDQGFELSQAMQSSPDRQSAEALLCLRLSRTSDGRQGIIRQSHAVLLNSLCWTWRNRPMVDAEVCACRCGPFSRDSHRELFSALLAGATSILLDGKVLSDVHCFVELLERHKVSRLVLQAMQLEHMLATIPDLAGRLPHLVNWTVTGGGVSAATCARFHETLPGVSLYAVLASMELGIDVAAFDTALHSGQGRIEAGWPIDNCQIYLLDDFLRPVPAGVVGDVYLGSAFLPQVLHTHDVFMERFVTRPFVPGLLYRSGERGRWDANDQLLIESAGTA